MKTKYNSDGTVTCWNVYTQQWMHHVCPDSLVLGTLTLERDRIIEHIVDHLVEHCRHGENLEDMLDEFDVPHCYLTFLEARLEVGNG